MDPSKPHPERFEVYNLLADGKSFTIKGCKFIFKLDRHGGWRDQNGHYYNSNGEPDFEPEDAAPTPEEGSLHSGEDYDDDYGEFEPDYDHVDDDEDQGHQNSWELRNIQRVSKNMQILQAYPLNKPLRVYFTNMSYKVAPKAVNEAYSKKVQGILNIIFDIQNEKRNGQGHFIMRDAKNAQELVNLQGEKVAEREVHFQVESFSDLIMDPIKEKDLVANWGGKQGGSKYYQRKQEKVQSKVQKKQQKKQQVPKFKAAPAQTKQKSGTQQSKTQQAPKPQIQQQQQPAQKKPQVKQPESKPQATKSQPQTPAQQFKRYLLNFQIFDTKTKFFNWLQENGGNKQTDIKNINKQQNNGVTKITMEVKTSLVQKLKGKKYGEKIVVFTLV